MGNRGGLETGVEAVLGEAAGGAFFSSLEEKTVSFVFATESFAEVFFNGENFLEAFFTTGSEERVVLAEVGFWVWEDFCLDVERALGAIRGKLASG